jgi:hypothetical protein
MEEERRCNFFRIDSIRGFDILIHMDKLRKEAAEELLNAWKRFH